jgi:hypothetical protein
MAKKKKKKAPATHQQVAQGKHSVTYYNTCYATTKRILQALGENESTFDVFTKRQKQDFFRVIMLPTRVEVTPGHKVPKQYIRYVQEDIIKCLKQTYFDEKHGVTWMDMATVGYDLMMACSAEEFLNTLPPLQLEVANRLHNLFEGASIFFRMQELITGRVITSLVLLSQPNFRIYGHEIGDRQSMIRRSFQPVVRITTHECQKLRFKYHNIERTAFRLLMGQKMSTPCTGVTIAMSTIFPGIKHDRMLNVYIQSHAIHRFKERVDTLYPIMRNEFFVISLMIVQRVVRAPNGTQLIACIIPSEDEKKVDEKVLGYFAFTIDGDNLLVLTLLPLLSRNVPEGRVLYERLHLSPEELKFLGMDKLSFFFDVDIAQIPLLKKVLYDELHLDYMHNVYNSYRSKNDPFNEKKTLFVKNFFDKLEERTVDINDEQNIDIIDIDAD